MSNGGALAPVVVVLGLVLAACGGQDQIAVAAAEICDAIDAEASDEIAFAEFERAVARERRDGLDEGELRTAVDERCGRAVAAISAAALAADEPEPVPEPEPELAVVDLRDVDWTALRWSTDCTEDGAVRALELSASPWDEPGVFVHAADPDSEMASGMVYSVAIHEAVFGDVTGDGFENAVFTGDCFLGNDYLFFIEVWGHDEDGRPAQLPTVLTYSKWEGLIGTVEIVDQRLRIRTSEPAPGEEEPHLNGYAIEVVTDWTFDGTGWVADEVDRVDTTPEPEPEPQPEPEPEPAPEPEPQPEPEPAPGACDQLGGFHHLGDEECAELLREIEECYQRYEADPDWVPYLDSLFENVITGEVAACDI